MNSTTSTGESIGFPVGMLVEGMKGRVKSITTTDEGKLKITVEAQIVHEEDLERIRDLLLVQRGDVMMQFTPAQGELAL